MKTPIQSSINIHCMQLVTFALWTQYCLLSVLHIYFIFISCAYIFNFYLLLHWKTANADFVIHCTMTVKALWFYEFVAHNGYKLLKGRNHYNCSEQHSVMFALFLMLWVTFSKYILNNKKVFVFEMKVLQNRILLKVSIRAKMVIWPETSAGRSAQALLEWQPVTAAPSSPLSFY